MGRFSDTRIELQETEDYRFGWESAERGEPEPRWKAETEAEKDRLWRQKMGWNDYIWEQIAP